MILIIGRKIYRAILFVLILIVILPVIHYYADRAVNPSAVHFREPRGQAIKVSTGVNNYYNQPQGITRFINYLHESYQNGL